MKRADPDNQTPAILPPTNQTILRAARGDPVDHVPVWMMRQAGRYLPEFLEVRKSADFFEMCETPSLVAETTLQPLERFDVDAVIVFSDILVIPQALGFEILMKPSVGPVFVKPLSDPSQIDSLVKPDISQKLLYVYDGIRETLKLLETRYLNTVKHVPLIGFSGAPWTLLSYMIEGKGSKTWNVAKKWLYCHPQECHKALALLTELITEHLILQVQAGAMLLQVFDSWAGILSPEQYSIFAIPYLEKIAKAVKKAHPEVPIILFAKGAHYLELLANTPYDVISLDWTMDPASSRKRLHAKAVQGNLDPCALYASDEEIQRLTQEMIKGFGVKGHIANLGHGLYPDMDPLKVGVFVKAVHDASKEHIQAQHQNK
uniref:Uroporphyrinogen decarboxylase n=1 Tax=Arcella intermedia TaxID=1963864 RepID=A0A6B2L739_9EUKA